MDNSNLRSLLSQVYGCPEKDLPRAYSTAHSMIQHDVAKLFKDASSKIPVMKHESVTVSL